MIYEKHLAEGVDGVFVETDRFNTVYISFNFFMPLNVKKHSNRIILPYLLTSSCEKYDGYIAINRKLASLYGADIFASVSKAGDCLRLKTAVLTLNDENTFDGDSVVLKAAEMLTDLLFLPKAENGTFSEKDLNRERRKLSEHIAGEYNDKRLYARNRMLEEMFEGTNYAISRYGKQEELEKVTGAGIYEEYLEMLKTAYIRINVIGKSIPQGFFEKIADIFSNTQRENITDCRFVSHIPERENAKHTDEFQEVAQGKLVMGFTAECKSSKEAAAFTVMTDIFGGGPYSKLFSNVREKMGLCYYCSAAAATVKGILTVDSGCESENTEKAETEILNQLEHIANGEISDFEFKSSIKSICDSLSAAYDSIAALDEFYSSNAVNMWIKSPEQFEECIRNVTVGEIVQMAKKVKLHTVYRLLPNGKGEKNEKRNI